MIAVKRIAPEQRELMDPEVQDLPAFIAYDADKLLCWCAYELDGERIRFIRLGCPSGDFGAALLTAKAAAASLRTVCPVCLFPDEADEYLSMIKKFYCGGTNAITTEKFLTGSCGDKE